jgi:hypothetical protein
MSIISAVMGAAAASDSGAPPPPTPTYTLTPAANSVNEGASLTFTVGGTNIPNGTYYWTVGADIAGISDFDAINGTVSVTGNSGTFSITPTADDTTEGAETFTVSVRSVSITGTILVTSTAVTINDTSRNTQTAALVLDLDPISLVGTGFGSQWDDTSGLSNTADLNNYTYSSDNDYIIIFNSTSTYATVPTLTTSTFDSVSVGAWIKPSSIGSDQVIISKELIYKLMISADGRIAWMVKNYADGNWTTTIFAAAGLVTTSTWSHVAATVNTASTNIYINGALAQTGSGLSLGVNNKRVAIGASDDNGVTLSGYYGGSMGRVEMWNYAITATSVLSYYNSTAARYGQSPVIQSLLFNGTQGQPLFVNGNTGDWALGTNGTIEWWQKTSKNSNDFGGNFNGGIIVQGNSGGSGGLDIFNAGGFLDVGLGGGGVQPYVTEPNTGTWVHVALSFAPNPSNLNVGLNHVYFNGVEQSLNNTSVALSNSTDTLRLGNRVPGANYQNWTGQISNLHISTATLYTDTFTPMIRTTATTGTVLLLDYYNPTVDLSYYELNNVAVASGNGAYLYISTSTYPNLINQIQIGNTVVANNTSTTVLVTGQVFLADPSNWGVPHSTGLIYVPATVNFSGARHTTTGTVTLTTDAPV